MSSQATVIVYGGAGALGTALVRYFKNKQWKTISVDVRINNEADKHVNVAMDASLTSQAEQVEIAIREILAGTKVDAILCVAGGWAGGNIASIGK
jgi:dihydropteridine reductase